MIVFILADFWTKNCFGNIKECHLWTKKQNTFWKMVWIFCPKNDACWNPRIITLLFLLDFCPEMTLAQFPEVGFFDQNSRIGIKSVSEVLTCRSYETGRCEIRVCSCDISFDFIWIVYLKWLLFHVWFSQISLEYD